MKGIILEVLEHSDYCEHYEIRENYLWLQFDGGYLHKTINMYEFASKCKKWALDKGYGISSYVFKHEDKTLGRATILTPSVRKPFIANTEMGAIFEACEWIIKISEVQKNI